MYGSHEIPLKISKNGISICVRKEESGFIYLRDAFESKKEKILMMKEAKIIINPVEPVRMQRKIATNILINFNKTLLIGPRFTKKIFLTFPIEIAAFVSDGKDIDVIDVFTGSKEKYALYGEVRNGVICRYWESDVYNRPPKKEIFEEGIIELNITNTTGSWAEVTKTVLNAYGMKIFYDEKKVLMRAVMKINSREMAETEFIDHTSEKNMKKSIELYTATKLNALSRNFVMENGL